MREDWHREDQHRGTEGGMSGRTGLMAATGNMPWE
jgi:hypothetical protein